MLFSICSSCYFWRSWYRSKSGHEVVRFLRLRDPSPKRQCGLFEGAQKAGWLWRCPLAERSSLPLRAVRPSGDFGERVEGRSMGLASRAAGRMESRKLDPESFG
jgi:hypothetical protein